MEPHLSPNSLAGLSVYQDVVLGGRTVHRGVRDCAARWDLIRPQLEGIGTVLDIGSNFGWFGLKMCEAFPECVVASVEADERSGEVQRQVLASHDHARICLLTSRANLNLAQRFAARGQRFDAALCLSVLHWLPDHRAFLAALGGMTAAIFVEHPDPREQGAGSAAILAEIGAIGDYLKACFPDRPVTCLGQTTSHRTAEFPREMWRVGPANGCDQNPVSGLDVAALLDLSVGWPKRSWWQAQWAPLSATEPARAEPENTPHRLQFTARGLQFAVDIGLGMPADELPRKIARIPEDHLLTIRQRWFRRVRRSAGNLLRRARLISAD